MQKDPMARDDELFMHIPHMKRSRLPVPFRSWGGYIIKLAAKTCRIKEQGYLSRLRPEKKASAYIYL